MGWVRRVGTKDGGEEENAKVEMLLEFRLRWGYESVSLLCFVLQVLQAFSSDARIVQH